MKNLDLTLKKNYLFSLFLIFFYLNTYAQDKKTKNTHLLTDNDRKNPLSISKNIAPTISLIPVTEEKKEETKREKKKKKKKKNKRFYYDIKIKRKYIRKRYRKNKTEIFLSVAKHNFTPPKYRLNTYYYNKLKKKIERISPDKLHKHALLHGHYIKKIDNIIVEEGDYYKGVKHGRWEIHTKKNILIDKKLYDRGFPKESEISYYDAAETKIKEVIPIHYNKKDGIYLKYYKSARVAERGRYKDGYKIGTWYTYYDKKRRRNKSTIKYPSKPYYSDDQSFIVKKWDSKGRKISNEKKPK